MGLIKILRNEWKEDWKNPDIRLDYILLGVLFGSGLIMFILGILFT